MTSSFFTQIGSDIDGEAAYDYSGFSVSLSADGSVVAIGATQNDGNGSDSGHVRIYKNVNDNWTQVGSDIDGEAAEDSSGISVSLSQDGTIVAIGATGNDGNGMRSGHVRIYKNVNDNWTKIGNDIDGEAEFDHFGTSVSLSTDGSVVAIGASGNDGNGTDSGHVRIYKNVNNSWLQIGEDIDGEHNGDGSGESVSLSADGSIVAIGAQLNSDNGTVSGHVRIYKNVNDNWTKIGNDIDGEAINDGLGSSVSFSADGSFVAISAQYNDGNGSISGHVRIYRVGITDFEALNYIASYGDLINAFGTDITSAKSHYTNNGIAEGRSVSLFSATDYLAKYSDLSAAYGDDQTSALTHYIQYGYSEGRTDSGSSSVSDSSSGSSSTTTTTTSPTALSDFEAYNYIASNNDLISAFGTDLTSAKSHYTNYGKSEGRVLDTFDEWGYLASNNDLMNVFGNDNTEAVKHYISYGKSEGRSTNIFSANSYLNNYADLKNAFGDNQTLATKHYVEYGFNEGRSF